jgi:hypothetical protein
MPQFNEGLKAGDLEGLVEKRFSVDQYKSKMGEDKNICVLAFVCSSAAGAKDLERFAEKGYKKVLDADATPGTMSDGKHRVFIEFPREEKLDQYLGEFLDDLKKLTNIKTFEFTYHKRTVPFEATRANLGNVIPLTPEAYLIKINSLKLGEVHSFFDKFQLLEFKLDKNIISVKKRGSQEELKFELHSYGDTNQVLKESKAFKIDADSMAECLFLTKYFGPFNITKTYENQFVFSKNGTSALVSKYKW